jgi:hypothetical protein
MPISLEAGVARHHLSCIWAICELLDSRIESIQAPSCDIHFGTITDEGSRDGEADSCSTASDQPHQSIQLVQIRRREDVEAL